MNKLSNFRNRNRLVIIAKMLEIANVESTLKTHLMYRANMSFSMLENYLGLLQDNGLLERRSDSENTLARYSTTEKGRDFLKAYEAMRNLLGQEIS